MAGTVVNGPAAAQPVLAAATVVAGFEIGMLLRCVRTGSGRYEQRSVANTAVELSRAAAAARLVSLLSTIGLTARRDAYAAGGRHRYTVHRVTCAELDDPRLALAWCTGYRRLCTAEVTSTTRQRRHRADLAAAAWRAALLAGGLRGRGGPLAVRVTDAELGLILVRAAREFGAPVSLLTARGRHLVEVAPGAAGAALRELACAEPPD